MRLKQCIFSTRTPLGEGHRAREPNSPEHKCLGLQTTTWVGRKAAFFRCGDAMSDDPEGKLIYTSKHADKGRLRFLLKAAYIWQIATK
jgi:hypothetical protein